MVYSRKLQNVHCCTVVNKLSATNLFQPFHGLDFVEEKLGLFDSGNSSSRHQGTSCLLFMVRLLLLAQHGEF
jgi:hypothetical protein